MTRPVQPGQSEDREAQYCGTAAPALLTDLYQLTMMDCYYRTGMEKPAVFEFYVRRLPEHRNFLIAAGLDQVLEYLGNLRFSEEEIDWLAGTGRFDAPFLARLKQFRFTGDVHAMHEGTVFFAGEPVLRVVAELPQAQFVESRIINLLHYQTVVASKAARCRLAAGDAQLIDFGLRRAHGAEAGCLAARASYLAGFDATATVEASRRYGMPLVGTMGHSYVQAHETESDAFRSFARCRSQDLTLLIDTYDTQRAAARAAELAREMQSAGVKLKAVRIDSGDLTAQAREVRRVLDAAGCSQTRIVVSGNIDEYGIAKMRASQAPIDTYCVGTRLAVSDDAPALDCAYKLQQYAGRPCRKRSTWKETWPGPRQTYRLYDAHGRIETDIVGCADEAREGRMLLHPVMVSGRRCVSPASLASIRAHCANELATLPIPLRALETVSSPIVKMSSRQQALIAQVDRVSR